ncbi:MAG: cyclic nucleotide-binding domain-containing protein, partial [Bdellovibrionales bacterium]|nr:cyclic nucleotide-binding domain-containing protein [Bdellovibrionales bacterium]
IQQKWADLLAYGQILVFQPGQIVYYENHQPMGAYLLCEGRIEFFKSGEPNFRRTISADSKPVLGMDFLVTQTPFEYSARAIERSKLCYLPKSKILHLIPRCHQSS